MNKKKDKNRVCPSCGAPILSEVCQYCGCRASDVDTAEIPVEYETLDCKNASLTLWNTFFAGIFAFMFSFFGFVFPFIFDRASSSVQRVEEVPIWLVCAPFAVVGVGASFILIYSFYKYFIVSLYGKEIKGIVYGYMDDTVYYNNQAGQVCKILVNTKKGLRFIFYSTMGTNKPYPINSELTLRVYKNYFRIMEKPSEDIF